MKGMAMTKILLRQRWMLIGLSCFLALFAVFAYDAHREATTTQYMKRMLSSGDLEQLEATPPVPPDSENGITLLLEAADKIQYPRDDEYIRFNSKDTLDSEEQEVLRKYVDMNAASLSLIHEALKYPHIQLSTHHIYDQYNNDVVYGEISKLVRLLYYWMIDAAIRNDRALLDEVLTTYLQFHEQFFYGNYLQHEMARQSRLYASAYYTEKLLNYAAPSQTVIRELVTLFTIDEQKAIDNARMQIINEVANNSSSYELDTNYRKIFERQSETMRVLGMAVKEWSQVPFIEGMLFTENFSQTLAVGNEDIYSAATFIIREQQEQRGNRPRVSKDHRLSKSEYALQGLFYPERIDAADIYRSPVFFIARLNGARCALASLLFYYDHDRMPNTLSELVPDYLDALPRDPFTPDKPIRYCIDGDVARFYSIGENEVDDGGISRVYDPQKRAYDCPNCDDIVFRLKVPQDNIPLDPPSTGEL